MTNNNYCSHCECEPCQCVGKHEVVHAAQNAAMRSVFEREIWNAAIEAAALKIDQLNKEGPYQAIAGANEIRKLKK